MLRFDDLQPLGGWGVGLVDEIVALVTGASRGIGLETARLFATAGAKVVLADVQDYMCKSAADTICTEGFDAAYTRCDFAKTDKANAGLAFTVERYGRLDCAVNNAGIEGQIAPLAEYEATHFEKIAAVNLKGVFNGLHAQIRQMLSQAGGGAIVNTSSLAGVVGFANLGPDVMTKHGVNGLTKTAAIEYSAQGIRTNSVCPGCIQTDMIDALAVGSGIASAEEALGPLHPLKRQGRPEEVAESIVWLRSDRASNVTGSVGTVDGGFTSQ